MKPIDFYFDFSSPYGYLASQKIEALAERHGRAVDWHPMLLGVVEPAQADAPAVRWLETGTAIGAGPDMSTFDREPPAARHAAVMPEHPGAVGRAAA